MSVLLKGAGLGIFPVMTEITHFKISDDSKKKKKFNNSYFNRLPTVAWRTKPWCGNITDVVFASDGVK